jgi:methyltransferase
MERVIDPCMPGVEIVTNGPYQYIRRRSYVAVALELLSLPVMFGAIYTAIVFSILNAGLMCVRIPIEKQFLSERNPGSIHREPDVL